MHQNTKLTPILRREIFTKWKRGTYSLRSLALEYHVDKKVIQRILIRGKEGDFSVHTSTNLRYKKKSLAPKKMSADKKIKNVLGKGKKKSIKK